MSTDNYYSAIIILGCVASKYKRAQYRGPKGYFSVKLEARYKSRVILSAAKVKQSSVPYVRDVEVNIVRSCDEIICLQCGTPHTEEYKLAIYSAQELEALLSQQEVISLKAYIAQSSL